MRDYSSAKIELMALKWSVCDKFKDYLLGSKFTVFTDNNPLCYIKSSKLGAAQIHWLSELALYDFDIVYRTGKSNLVADALSRRPEVEEEIEKETPPESDDDEWITVSYQVEEQEGCISSMEFNGLRDHYHQAMAREMIRSRPTLSYVAYKSEVLKTLGPNVKPRSITTSKLETSDIESPPKKRKRESELDQKINAAIEENRKLSERLSAFDPKTITDTVINAVQGNYQGNKPAGFAPKQFKPSQFYGKPCEPQLVPGTDDSLKPEIDCNYCKDLGHLKYNCPKLKEKEARMAGHRDYNKSKKEN